MASATSSRPGIEWSEGERAAWAWAEQLPPSVWCDANIVIPDNAINPEPGPYSIDRTPYLREIIDTAVDPVAREIWCYKPTQVGWTRLLINLVCYFAAQQPGATGILYPDEDTVEEVFAEELKPTIDQSATMAALKTGRAWDSTADEVWLRTGPIFGLYAGSVQKLARRSLRYIIGDEIDKYRPFKNEASPIQLLKKRTSNWMHRAFELYGSTPTTRDGNITAGYEACPEKREYFCRCPHCGEYELWQWASVKGFRDAPGATKHERADWVKRTRPAFYLCRRCGCPITDADKVDAVARGVWVSGVTENQTWRATQTVRPDGTLDGDRRPATRIGFHLTALLSPWLTFSDLAAEFIEAEGDRDKSRDFRNARLAQPWDEVVRSVRPSTVRDKRSIAGKPLIVPKWAVRVFAVFDTQDTWFAGTIRAWGGGFKSALLWHGECQKFDEVYRIGLESRLMGEDGRAYSPSHLLIDSGGNRTNEVYEFARRDPRIVPMKGANHAMRKPWSRSDLENGLSLIFFDPNHYKDMLSRLIADPDLTKHLPHCEVSEQYCLEMASEHKIVSQKTKRQEWVPTGSARQEAWDCEVMQCVAADIENVALMAPDETLSPASTAADIDTANPLSYRGRW